MTLLSVVVPAYNSDDTLSETLDAVIAQTMTEWECIVVDDGSSDGTLEVARSYEAKEPRIRAISQENRGTGGAYNTGVRAASAGWITICSADDVLLPSHLEVMARAIRTHPSSDIISCNGYYWMADDSRELVYGGESGRTERSWSMAEVLDRCFFSVGACYRREIHDLVGGYREDVYGEDYDFWLRAMAAGARHLYVPEPLALHRITPAQKSANLTRAFESDIRSISSVLKSGALSRDDWRAARAAIRHRKRMILEVTSPSSVSVRLRRRLRAFGRKGE